MCIMCIHIIYILTLGTQRRITFCYQRYIYILIIYNAYIYIYLCIGVIICWWIKYMGLSSKHCLLTSCWQAHAIYTCRYIYILVWTYIISCLSHIIYLLYIYIQAYICMYIYTLVWTYIISCLSHIYVCIYICTKTIRRLFIFPYFQLFRIFFDKLLLSQNLRKWRIS